MRELDRDQCIKKKKYSCNDKQCASKQKLSEQKQKHNTTLAHRNTCQPRQ